MNREREAIAHWDRRYAEKSRAAWTSHPLVLAEVCRRMTGENKFWLNWIFEDFVKRPVERLLSVGCGDGAHELIISERRYAATIDAFDLSPVAISTARENAKAKGVEINFYERSFDEFVAHSGDDNFDMILFSGSLHHVENLEGVLAKTRSLLAPEGLLVVNEYVGPCYNIYPQKQVDLINSFLAALPAEFKIHPGSQWSNPTIETCLMIDPSESVRSTLIPVFLGYYFNFEWRRGFGGSLLHPIFDHLDFERLNRASPDAEAIVQLLINVEQLLIDAGALQHDFLFAICSPKDVSDTF